MNLATDDQNCHTAVEMHANVIYLFGTIRELNQASVVRKAHYAKYLVLCMKSSIMLAGTCVMKVSSLA